MRRCDEKSSVAFLSVLPSPVSLHFFFPSALSCLCLSCVKENYSRHCPFRVFLDTKYFLLILVVPAPLSHCFITFFFFFYFVLCCYVKKSKVWSHAACVPSVWYIYIYIHICLCVCRVGLRQLRCQHVLECSQQSVTCGATDWTNVSR